MIRELKVLTDSLNGLGGCDGVPVGFVPGDIQIPGISCDGGAAVWGVVTDIVAGLVCSYLAGATPPASIVCGAFAATIGGIIDNVVQDRAWYQDVGIDALVGGISAVVFDELAAGLGRVRSLRAAARGLVDACGSFSADTQVLLGSGARVAISDVEVGDLVLATDPVTGETGPRQVTATWPHEDTLVDLVVSSGAISTTEDHEFWNVTDRAWQQSQHLDFGDLLRSADGTIVTVERLDWATSEYSTAYDLTVDDTHTFYVAAGDAEVLVHNCLPHNARIGAPGIQSSGSIDPNTIRWTQNNAAYEFRGGPWPNVDALIADLSQQSFDVSSVDPIRIFSRNGHIHTLDHRRLWAFRQADVDIPYRFATETEILNELPGKWTTLDEGLSFYVRPPRQ